MADGNNAKILPFAQPGTQSGRDNGEVTERNGDTGVGPVELDQSLRMVEAILFASAEPVSEKVLAERLPEGTDLSQVLAQLQRHYEPRGVNLVRIGGNWAFRTADDLGFLLHRDSVEPKKLSRAGLEVLSIIAYHQPVTRAEIEEIRGVATSKGTLDVLLETGWVRMRGRRRSPGKPITYGTTDGFLDHFGLAELRDLPGLDELKGAGLLQSNLPSDFRVPVPSDDAELGEDEEPFGEDDLEALGLLAPKDFDDDREE